MGATARMGLGAVAAIVVAVAVYFGVRPAPQGETAVPPVKLAEPAATEAAPVTPAPDVAAPVAAPEVAASIAPTLDVVRVGPDGATTIAGKAAPGAAIGFILDGAEVFSTTADASGNFVGLFNLPSSEAARMLSVVAKAADGGTQSIDVAIAPIKPLVVAEAAPDAAPVVAGEAAQAPAALLISPEGVKVVQPETAVPAEVAANVSVDSIAYGGDGSVQLGGRGMAGSALRIYLDQAAVAEATVGQGGDWAVRLGDVAPGLYTLRVDQLGEAGSVVSRFETPFKRETLEALAQAAAPAVPAKPPEIAPAPEVVASAEPSAPAAEVTPPAVVAEPTPAPAASQPQPEAAPEPGAASTPAAPAKVEETPAPVAVAKVAPPAAEVPAAAPEVAAAPAAEAPQVSTEVAEAAAPAPDSAPAVSVAVSTPEVGTAAALPAPAAAASEVAKTAVSITVQPGFTLWGIAKSQMGEGVMYVQVFEANKERIKNPDLIYPGQVFTIPGSP
jgi:nucleoid-associated protein YgaU